MSTWSQTFRHRHNIAVVVLLGLALLAAPFLTALPLTIQLVILATAVVIFGLPHGALDLTLIRIRGSSSGSACPLAISILIYLLGSAAVIAAWLSAPVAALGGFLVIALVHFGLGDTEELRGPQRALEVIVRGGFSTFAPLFFQPQTTLALFTMLTGSGSAGLLYATSALMMTSAGWLWGTCLAIAVLWRVLARKSGWLPATLELILTTAVFAVLHPLVAFLLYFNFVHSIRHLADLGAARFPASAARAGRWLLMESLPFTAATLLLSIIAWVVLGSSFSQDESLMRIIFWGLSALTVPHMILVGWWHARGVLQPGDLFASKFMR